jgi:hypothetical protein
VKSAIADHSFAHARLDRCGHLGAYPIFRIRGVQVAPMGAVIAKDFLP